MMTLVLSISCSVAVSVLLKLAKPYHLKISQSIAVNYVIASFLCLVLLQPRFEDLGDTTIAWSLLLLLGVLLPSIFLIMAAAVKQAGIVLSDAAQRLSLLLPLLASFLFFGETATPGKLLGILCALVALGCLLARSSSPNPKAALPVPATVLLLLGVWLGYGSIDILFKQLARTGAHFATSLLGSFVLAGVLMFGSLLFGRAQWHRPSLGAGVILGLLNFGNIYFYIRAHQAFPEHPALIFSAMNIGVISLGALVGTVLFSEKLSRINWFGLLLSVVAIILLLPR